MPQKCYYKPNRRVPRRWTARAAARAVCAAREAGFTEREIKDALADCIDCGGDRRRARAQQLAAVGLAAVEGSNQTLVLADGVLSALELVVRIVNRVSRFFPPARAATVPLTLVEARVGSVRNAIRVQRAANDAALAALRRAA